MIFLAVLGLALALVGVMGQEADASMPNPGTMKDAVGHTLKILYCSS